MKKNLFIMLLALATLQIPDKVYTMDADPRDQAPQQEHTQSPTKKRGADEANRQLSASPELKSPEQKRKSPDKNEASTGLTPLVKKIALKQTSESTEQNPIIRKIAFDSVATSSSSTQFTAAAAATTMQLMHDIDTKYSQINHSKPFIIFLNGTSSVGKSSISEKFISRLENSNFSCKLVSMDELMESMESQLASLEKKLGACKSKRSKLAKQIQSEIDELEAKLEKSDASVTIEKVSEKIAEGSSVICDIVVTDKQDFEEIEKLKANANVFIMLVYCPIDIVIERVISRNKIADDATLDDNSDRSDDESYASDDSDYSTTKSNKRKLYQVLEGFSFIYSFMQKKDTYQTVDTFDHVKFGAAIESLKKSGNFDEKNDPDAINRYISPEKPFLIPIYQNYDLVLHNYSRSMIETYGDAKVADVVMEILDFLVSKKILSYN